MVSGHGGQDLVNGAAVLGRAVSGGGGLGQGVGVGSGGGDGLGVVGLDVLDGVGGAVGQVVARYAVGAGGADPVGVEIDDHLEAFLQAVDDLSQGVDGRTHRGVVAAAGVGVDAHAVKRVHHSARGSVR